MRYIRERKYDIMGNMNEPGVLQNGDNARVNKEEERFGWGRKSWVRIWGGDKRLGLGAKICVLSMEEIANRNNRVKERRTG